MSLLNRISRINFISLAKYSVNSLGGTGLHFKSNFTQDDQSKILNILNGSNADQLYRLEIPLLKIKKIKSWKNKKGPFKTLDEVLEVDGISEQLLQQMCDGIINLKDDFTDKLGLNNNNNRKLKRNKQLLTPNINGNILNKISSAVGVHLSPIGVSWAKINKEGNKLVCWNFENFNSLPKKMLLNDTFAQSINLVKKIPSSDIYIFETNPTLGPQSQSYIASAYSQQLELNAMLLALINTSPNHNVTLQNTPKCIENRVFYLKSRIPARLFNTLVGQEKVAAAATIKQLLENEIDFCLPCTPIAVDPPFKIAFNSQSPANKELLGQALMLIISFMDLCVYKNPLSFTAINTNRNVKNVNK